MIDILLMLWSCLLMVSLFTCYIIVDITKGDILSFFLIGMLLMGVIFLFFVNNRYKQTKNVTYVLQKGYENYVFIGTYIILFIINLAIILGIYTTISVSSPVFMLTWLLPILCYSFFQSMWLCFDHTLHITSQRDVKVLPYKNIKKIMIKNIKKKKVQISIITNNEEYRYIGKEESIFALKEYIITKNKVDIIK